MGDEGLGRDLMESADVDVEPAVDWGALAEALAKSDLGRARELAGENIAANALVDRHAGK